MVTPGHTGPRLGVSHERGASLPAAPAAAPRRALLLQPASTRFLAWLLDTALLTVAGVVVFRTPPTTFRGDFSFTFLAWMVASLLYFFVCEAVWGATPGKRAFKMHVVMLDGSPLTTTAALRRTLERIPMTLPFVNWIYCGVVGLVIWLSDDCQRWGDRWGGCIVVRETTTAEAPTLRPGQKLVRL